MRFVGLLPHPGKFDRYAPDFADNLIGTAMPYREYPGGPVLDPKVGRVVAARVDDEGVHLEIEVEPDSPTGEKLRNLAIYGTAHGPDEVLPAQPTFSVGYGEVTAVPDPLLRIGCVQPSGALDSQENRDALREIVKAAVRRMEEEHGGEGQSQGLHGH
jgi:hypothetical protein